MEQVPNDNESAVQVSVLPTRLEPQANEVLEKMLTQLQDEVGALEHCATLSRRMLAR